jgi:hypothetical protein
MGRGQIPDRRRFLGSIGASLPAALLGQGTGAGRGPGFRSPALDARKAHDPGQSLDSSPVIVGDDAIAFRRHTLDLGACEAVCVVDMNGDGRLDIV